MHFEPQTALEYAQALSIPRLVGSEGEARVRQAIAERLEGSGYHVELQAFVFSTAPGVVLSLQILLGQLLILGILLLDMAQRQGSTLLAWLILGLLACSGPAYQLARRQAVAPDPSGALSMTQKGCLRLGTTFSSANIVASTPDSNMDPDRPHLVLVAHYDSKSQNLSLPIRIALFVVLMLSCAAFALLTLLATSNPTPGSIPSVLGTIAILAGIPLLMMGTGNASPGAIDNASGMGLVLHLAELLAAQTEITKNLRVTLLFTGAEELGVMGAQAYVARHRETLLQQQKEQGLTVLNFDGLGVDGALGLVGQAHRRSRYRRVNLTTLIEEACQESGIALRRTTLPGALLDHMPFARIGLDAVSLVGVGRASLSVHTKMDRPDRLHPRGFELPGQATLQVIKKLTSGES